MNIGLYLGAAALGTLDRWQETIATNLGSNATPGFRRREMEFSMNPLGTIDAGPPGSGITVPAVFPKPHPSVSFMAGQVNNTGRDLDFSIQGDGFFEIQMPDGSHAFTRSGGFYLNNDRVVVDSQGRPLLGDGNAQIQLLSDGGSLTVAADGTLTQGKQPIGKIAIFRFADQQSLQPISGGLFMPGDGQAPEQVEQPTLVQGALESSNVQPVEEMMNLVQVSRAYESAQKIINSRDDNLDKTIRAFG